MKRLDHAFRRPPPVIRAPHRQYSLGFNFVAKLVANRDNDLEPLMVRRTRRDIAEQFFYFRCRKLAVMVSIVHHLPLSTGLPAMTSLRRDQSVELYVSRNLYSLLGSLRRIDGRSFVSIRAKSARVLFLIIKFYSYFLVFYFFQRYTQCVCRPAVLMTGVLLPLSGYL